MIVCVLECSLKESSTTVGGSSEEAVTLIGLELGFSGSLAEVGELVVAAVTIPRPGTHEQTQMTAIVQVANVFEIKLVLKLGVWVFVTQLHCHYTVVTLLLCCCYYTVVTLLLFCCYTYYVVVVSSVTKTCSGNG